MRMTGILRIVLAFGLLLPTLTFGFSVRPSMAELDPGGGAATILFRLQNPSDVPKAIEVSVAIPEMDENGVETLRLGAGEADFLVLPQQVILPPKSRRTVKAVYVADPPERELTYRIIFEESPVEMQDPDVAPANPDEARIALKLALRYVTRIWVGPSELTPEIDVASFAPVEEGIAVRLLNRGGKHAYLTEPSLEVEWSNGRTWEAPAEILKPMRGQALLADFERVFRLPWRPEYGEIADIEEIRFSLQEP